MRPTGLVVHADIARAKTTASRIIGADNKDPDTAVKRTTANNALNRLRDPFGAIGVQCRETRRSVTGCDLKQSSSAGRARMRPRGADAQLAQRGRVCRCERASQPRREVRVPVDALLHVSIACA